MNSLALLLHLFYVSRLRFALICRFSQVFRDKMIICQQDDMIMSLCYHDNMLSILFLKTSGMANRANLAQIFILLFFCFTLLVRLTC
jgi:hypothetical protein